jgi:hypothetical protein
MALTACTTDGGLVGRYCNYGSTSKAQYDGCVEHTDVEDVTEALERNSDAAIYAEECDGSPGKYTGPDTRPDCF